MKLGAVAAAYHLAGRMMKSSRSALKGGSTGGESEGRRNCGEKQQNKKYIVVVLSEVSSWLYTQLQGLFSVSLSFTEAFTAVAKGERPAGRGQYAEEEEEEARFDNQAVAEGRGDEATEGGREGGGSGGSNTVHPGTSGWIYLFLALPSCFVCARAPPTGVMTLLQTDSDGLHLPTCSDCSSNHDIICRP